MSERDWHVAADIQERISDLRVALGGISKAELARRAGVRSTQVGRWESGEQTPSKTRLESWATRQGWPIEIFAEGGPMPSAVLSAQQPGGVSLSDSERIVQLLRSMSETSSALSKAQELLAAGHVDAAEDVLRGYIDLGELKNPPDAER